MRLRESAVTSFGSQSNGTGTLWPLIPYVFKSTARASHAVAIVRMSAIDRFCFERSRAVSMFGIAMAATMPMIMDAKTAYSKGRNADRFLTALSTCSLARADLVSPNLRRRSGLPRSLRTFPTCSRCTPSQRTVEMRKNTPDTMVTAKNSGGGGFEGVVENGSLTFIRSHTHQICAATIVESHPINRRSPRL